MMRFKEFLANHRDKKLPQHFNYDEHERDTVHEYTSTGGHAALKWHHNNSTPAWTKGHDAARDSLDQRMHGVISNHTTPHAMTVYRGSNYHPHKEPTKGY